MFTADTIDKTNKLIDKKIRELIKSGIDITKWCHCTKSKEEKEIDIKKFEQMLEEES